MTRKALLWLSALAVLAVVVAVQVVRSAGDHADEFRARAGVPTVQPGADILAGITLLPKRNHHYGYRRGAFGEAWDDDNDAPGGHNGCDTRDDILNRDLIDKTYVSTTRCPNAVATGTLHDPYTNVTVAFTRGAKIGASVQIDHIVPLALAWDLGAYDWSYRKRLRFANDPANLVAVAGAANDDKGDGQPALWMPANRAFWCQYGMAFVGVLRGYELPIDAPSAAVLRHAGGTCPRG
jgi:hypothetical protein